MKKLLTTLLVGLIGLQAFGQSFNLSSDTSFAVEDLNNVYIDGSASPLATKINVTNTSSSAKTMRWSKTNVLIPSGWYTSVCDNGGCYDSSVITNSFTIAAGASVEMIVDFYAVSAGLGVSSLHIYDEGNTSDAVDPVFVVTINKSSGVAKVTKVKDVQLSPVPARENLFVVYDKALAPSKMEVYNVLGQLVKTEKVFNDGAPKVQISLMGFEKGLYFLRIYAANGKVITRQFSKD